MAQSGWPPDDEYLEEARSPRVDLADVVARLQKEGHDSWGVCLNPEQPRPVYRIDDVKTEVSPPRVTPIPLDRELLIQRLMGTEHHVRMGTEHHVRPVLQERSSLTDMDILIQSLLPVGSLEGENLRPAADHHESTVVCFSCGESGHAALRCPVLDDSFPFLPPGWQADWMGDGFILRPPLKGADRHQAGNVV